MIPTNISIDLTGADNRDVQLGWDDNSADNGGPTYTHALLSGSPALDQIPTGVSGCGTDYTSDQRGESRPQNGLCDVGAFELTTTTR